MSSTLLPSLIASASLLYLAACGQQWETSSEEHFVVGNQTEDMHLFGVSYPPDTEEIKFYRLNSQNKIYRIRFISQTATAHEFIESVANRSIESDEPPNEIDQIPGLIVDIPSSHFFSVLIDEKVLDWWNYEMPNEAKGLELNDHRGITSIVCLDEEGNSTVWIQFREP